MPATIIGSPSATATAANAKLLRRQNFQKEPVGLDTLVETYYIQTQNLASLIPAKDQLHSAYSTAITKYSRMAVESISSSEQDGGITELNITYVGLTSSSGLPPAVVNIIPQEGAGVFGPPVVVQAEFVTDVSVAALVRGQFSSLSYGTPSAGVGQTQMPSQINGTSLPTNPRQPFSQEGTGLASSFYYRYDGYIVRDYQAIKRGIFHVATITFSEYAVSIGGVSGGWANRFGKT